MKSEGSVAVFKPYILTNEDHRGPDVEYDYIVGDRVTISAVYKTMYETGALNHTCLLFALRYLDVSVFVEAV